jgi:hypothetical protein
MLQLAIDNFSPEETAEVRAKAPSDKVEEALKAAKRNKRKAFFTEEKRKFAETEHTMFVEEQPLNEERSEELAIELIKRLNTKDFAKLYAFAQVECAGNLDRKSLEGEWVKYVKGSDPSLLEDGLKGKSTGWCTAEGAAEEQLANGDFYVFYTKNKAGVPTEPRIAIRMDSDRIAEIRGVNPRQELEPELVETAREKYQHLPGAQKYEKADKDMKRMTALYQKYFHVDPKTKEKTLLSPTLTKEDIRFLYEIDEKIDGFGYDKDPRITEILETRDMLTDIIHLFNRRPEQVSLTEEEAVSDNIHYGDLSLLSLKTAEGLVLPETIGGSLNLRNLKTARDVTFPKTLEGYFFLGNLEKAEIEILRSRHRHLKII